MSSEKDQGPNRFERKMAEMSGREFSPWPHLLKGLAVFASYYFGGWPGTVFIVYLLIGDSLARRVGQERWKMEWLAVTLLWPIPLTLDVVGWTPGDA